ncbi:MAG TPA: precorrin-4 C(11)-methyltransferase [Streptosporangiaceae bacterium]|nr:precorrin-4 C(11)-methyltransferase [Streptosporangiaceae bacterium]
MKTLIGVGMGPGDPELVTMKAVRVLREADVVVVPVLGGALLANPGEPGRAESIVRAYVDDNRVKRLEFALDDTGGVTPRRAAAWRDAAAAVAAEFDGGAVTVAFGTLGDPNLYSTFSYLAQTVRELVPDVQVATVAGITAMQDLASRSGISLAEGTEPLTLVPLNASPEVLDQALAHGGAVVGYKLGAKASPPPAALRARLAAAGRLDGAVIGARLGLPGEHITPAGTLLPEPAPPAPPAPQATPAHISDIPYLSTLIVPALRSPGAGSSLANRVVAATTRLYARGCHNDADGEAHEGRSGGERRGTVAFVGAGPGAADLLTLRGARTIRAADIVIWASSLVHPDVPRHAAAGAEIVDSAALPMEGVLPYYERAARDGLRVARVHSGDPSLWGAIQEQLEQCERLGLATEIVPGVSSFTAVAARIGRELTIPEVAQSVILTRLGGGKTPMPPGERVADFARHGTTMALFLSAARSGQLQDELLAGGYPADTPCVVAFQVTWPDELILHCALADLAGTIRGHKLWKHTLVLVGPGLAAGGSRSHLYHPGHFHGHRKADRAARLELRGSRP